MRSIVQISLDLTYIDEALETAEMALRAGMDWLEAGTTLIFAEGLHGVRKLREAFPGILPSNDLKKVEGGAVGYAKMLSHGKIGKGMKDYDAILLNSSALALTIGLASKTAWMK